MAGPLISVLINNHNYGRYVSAAIDSVLNQTYSNLEIIVVDDGSTDKSRNLIASYGSRVHSVFQEQGGQASAFNAGFAASRGDLVCLLDADDMFLPTKAESLVSIFMADTTIGWCFDRVVYLFELGKECDLAAPMLAPGTSYGRWDVQSMVQEKGYAPYMPAPTSALSFRRSLLERILPMPVASSVRLSDNYLKFLAVGLSPGIFSNQELSIQRIHQANAYTSGIKSKNRLGAQIGLTTGYHLLRKTPEMRRLAIRMCTLGLVRCWIYGGVDRLYWLTFSQFRKELNAREFFGVLGEIPKILVRDLLKRRSSLRSSTRAKLEGIVKEDDTASPSVPPRQDPPLGTREIE